MRLRAVRATISILMAAGLAGGCSDWIHTTSSERPAATDQKTAPVDNWRAINNLVTAPRPVFKKMLATMPAYSDGYVRAAGPSTFEYVYVYANQVDAAAAQPTFDSYAPTLQSTVDTTVGPSMRRAGIPAPKVTYTYLNPDGSLVWTHTFEETKQSS